MYLGYVCSCIYELTIWKKICKCETGHECNIACHNITLPRYIWHRKKSITNNCKEEPVLQ